MKIVKISKTDGRSETKGCRGSAEEILKQLKEIWLNEDFKTLNFEISEEGGLYLGGDHSNTYNNFIKSECDGLLVFDAHPDVYQEFNNATHLDWLKFLIDENKVKKENIVLVGIRSFHKKEINYLIENKIKYFDMKKIFELDVKETCSCVMELVRNFKKLYLSIDIDVVDPGFAPGVGFAEPGGLSSRDMIYFVQKLKLLKNLKKVDIVEINTEKDINNITSKLAAKLIWELI